MIITERKMKNCRRDINKIRKYFINLVYLKIKLYFVLLQNYIFFVIYDLYWNNIFSLGKWIKIT